MAILPASAVTVVRAIAIALLTLLGAAPSVGAAADRLAIVGAKAYPDENSAPIEDAVILIRGDRIEKVGPRGTTRVPAGYRIIEQKGRVATAGFWNSHVHLTTPTLIGAAEVSDADLQRELERAFTRWGFTTIFDLASTSAVAGEIERRIEARRVNGPRILSAMEPFYPSGATPIYARPFYEAYKLPSAEISTRTGAVQRARAQLRRGADGIKLFTGSIVGEREVVHMPAASIAAISQAARRLGKPVFAHPTDRTGLELAVRNGADILAHAAALMGKWSADYARWIASHGVALIPTLSLFEVQPHPSTPVSVAVQQVAALHRAGGTILFGTDAGFTEAFDTTAELRLLSEAIGWRGVLGSLTTSPARQFGEARTRGRLRPGYAADIVVLGGDPAAAAENLADIRMVVRGGRTIFIR